MKRPIAKKATRDGIKCPECRHPMIVKIEGICIRCERLPESTRVTLRMRLHCCHCKYTERYMGESHHKKTIAVVEAFANNITQQVMSLPWDVFKQATKKPGAWGS